MQITVFEKRLLVLRAKLSGRGYYRALAALEFALRYHTGTRKDGVSPEFDHQVSISLFLLTIDKLLMDPEGTIVTAILHDTTEDFPVFSADLMSAIFYQPVDQDFGRKCVASIDLLNKYERDGTLKNEDHLYEMVAQDVRASIVKPCDRWHNLNSMVGVFSYPKQADYADFAQNRILPLMKKARRLFPWQEDAYENIKWKITDTIRLIRQLHDAVGAVDVRTIEITDARI